MQTVAPRHRIRVGPAIVIAAVGLLAVGLAVLLATGSLVRGPDLVACPEAVAFECGAVGGDDGTPPLRYAVEPGRGNEPYLVVVPGGPGISAIATIPERLALLPAAISERFRLVLVEPPAASPSLACWDAEARLAAARWSAPTTGDLLDASARFPADCLDEAGPGSGGVVAAFGSATAAGLLDRARAQLRVDRWAILADSYGTLLALEYARRHPERVDRLVIDAPSATSDTVATELGAAVRDAVGRWEEACRRTACTPGIETTAPGLFARLLDVLLVSPAPVLFDGGPISIRARDFQYLALVAQLRLDLRSEYLRLLVDADAGDWSGVGQAVAGMHALDPVTLVPRFTRANPALGGYFAGRCADSGWRHLGSEARRERYLAATMGADGTEEIGVLMAEAPCITWPGASRLPQPLDPGALAVPVLIVHSADDGLTSPSMLGRLRTAPGAVELSVVGGGHISIGSGACVDEAVLDFLAGVLEPGAVLSCPAEFRSS